jgi:hypothetical protein
MATFKTRSSAGGAVVGSLDASELLDPLGVAVAEPPHAAAAKSKIANAKRKNLVRQVIR